MLSEIEVAPPLQITFERVHIMVYHGSETGKQVCLASAAVFVADLEKPGTSFWVKDLGLTSVMR